MTDQTYDPRTVSTCVITWGEDRTSGRGYFAASFDDGGKCEINEETAGVSGPITSATDSDEIAQAIAAELMLVVLFVEHDGEHIHATMRQR